MQALDVPPSESAAAAVEDVFLKALEVPARESDSLEQAQMAVVLAASEAEAASEATAAPAGAEAPEAPEPRPPGRGGAADELAWQTLQDAERQARPILLSQARQALQDAEKKYQQDAPVVEKLAEARERLAEIRQAEQTAQVYDAEQTAQVYDRVWEAWSLVHRASDGDERALKPVKDAALVVREVLILQCCAVAHSASSAAFDKAILDAFRKKSRTS